jgi:hypothetical protein
MTIGNKRSRNIMHNHDTSIMETEISILDHSIRVKGEGLKGTV